MVTWSSDTLFAAFAYASTLIATLRAGSRAFYLIEHDQIDVMDGPLILGPGDVTKLSNGTATVEVSPLWELASVFQQSVHLALDPDRMEYRVLTIGIPQEEEKKEPYSLSPFPVKKRATAVVDEEEDFVVTEIVNENTSTSLANEDVTVNVEVLAEDIVAERSHDRLAKSPSFVSRMSVRAALAKVPFFDRWMGQQDDSDDESFSFDDMEFDEWDFDYCMSTDIPYRNTSESTNKWAEITAYAPVTFADLRSRFGISEQDFRQSILQSGPFVSFQSNSKGAARVGGVFFFTRDGAYMIKTIKKEEARTLLKMLPKYHKYMKRNGRRSLLTRFCGMYGVSLGTSRTSSSSRNLPHRDHENIFVVMNSVFPAAGSHFISERFDLKGSTVGRECSEEEKEAKGKNAILKDLDLAREVELVKSLIPPKSSSVAKYGLHVGPTVKSALMAQLRRDLRLLVNCGVMDYSLLVGVVNMSRHQLDNESMRQLELSELQESRMEIARRAREKKSLERAFLSAIVTPIRILVAPPLFLARRIWSEVDNVFSSILTLPLPYYGAENPGVNGGVFSVVKGQRSGNRVIFFMGLIDFLQPWTTRKVIERRLKGVLGYDMHAISCVPPEEYASRFLEFIGAHVS